MRPGRQWPSLPRPWPFRAVVRASLDNLPGLEESQGDQNTQGQETGHELKMSEKGVGQKGPVFKHLVPSLVFVFCCLGKKGKDTTFKKGLWGRVGRDQVSRKAKGFDVHEAGQTST